MLSAQGSAEHGGNWVLCKQADGRMRAWKGERKAMTKFEVAEKICLSDRDGPSCPSHAPAGKNNQQDVEPKIDEIL